MGVEIGLLGGFEVRVGGAPVPSEEWRRRNAAALVKLFALAPGRQLQGERVIDALWPDVPVDDAAPRLHKAAHYARRALGERSIVLTGGGVALCPDEDVTVDAADFQAVAEKTLADETGWALARATAARAADTSEQNWQLLDLVTLQGLIAHNRGQWFQRPRLELQRVRSRPELAVAVFDSHLCVAEYLLYGPTPTRRSWRWPVSCGARPSAPGCCARPRSPPRCGIDRARATMIPTENCRFCNIMLAVPAAIAGADAGDLDAARRRLAEAEKSAALWEGTAWQAQVRPRLALSPRSRGKVVGRLPS